MLNKLELGQWAKDLAQKALNERMSPPATGQAWLWPCEAVSVSCGRSDVNFCSWGLIGILVYSMLDKIRWKTCWNDFEILRRVKFLSILSFSLLHSCRSPSEAWIFGLRPGAFSTFLVFHSRFLPFFSPNFEAQLGGHFCGLEHLDISPLAWPPGHLVTWSWRWSIGLCFFIRSFFLSLNFH